MEEITTRDERSHICSNGQRVLPSGGVSEDGPPTTLSGTGIDRVAFIQSNITRDNTKFVNGTIVGERNVFQVTSFSLLCMFVIMYGVAFFFSFTTSEGRKQNALKWKPFCYVFEVFVSY